LRGDDRALPETNYSEREMIHLIRAEGVEHLDDLLLRRTTLAISGQLTLNSADAALAVLAAERGWDEAARQAERNRFLTLLAERHGVTEQMLASRNKDRSTTWETTARSG
jgi:glycerol-3-phosphate dehydrogenase